MLQLCRGSAEIDCPAIGTCRNVGSNLGVTCVMIVIDKSVNEISLRKAELRHGRGIVR